MAPELPLAERDAAHNAAWRNTAEVAAQWAGAGSVDAASLAFEAEGGFWRALEEARITLLVTREYEHLLLALTVLDGRPLITTFSLPHPSGLAWDAARGVVSVACTRNPNQIFDLAPVDSLLPRGDFDLSGAQRLLDRHPLLPVRARYLPGGFYLHDLAMINGELHANSVGQNMVAHLAACGGYQPAWWPVCIERSGQPDFSRNYLQLNSIAAGPSLAESYFSASCAEMGASRPGDADFAVDGRGVLFSGQTRQPVAAGLTRPHSARLWQGRLLVDNSGYGQLCTFNGSGFDVITQLPGWTRGLGLTGSTAFVGTSRVLPRFTQYAPGLNPETARCGLHAVDLVSGRRLGSLFWLAGNQIFAIEPVPQAWTCGFPFVPGALSQADPSALFYSFIPSIPRGE